MEYVHASGQWNNNHDTLFSAVPKIKQELLLQNNMITSNNISSSIQK